MSMDVRVHEAETHVSIKAAGPYSFENLCTLFARATDESEKRVKQRVILDITEMAGLVSTLDMHRLGTYFCGVWNRAVRIAIVSPVGGLNKFFESVLWTRGVQVAVVPSRCAAMEWVIGGE
jgi:hypothetical protein